MHSKPPLALLVGATLLGTAVYAETSPQTAMQTPGDSRQLVEMPVEAQFLMRQDMLDHLSALNTIIMALGSGDLNTAADTAERRMGRASTGKYRASGMGPGRFMPPEMRNLGWNMHAAADTFATEARKGDPQRAYAALQQVTNACVTCHAVYRTR